MDSTCIIQVLLHLLRIVTGIKDFFSEFCSSRVQVQVSDTP